VTIARDIVVTIPKSKLAEVEAEEAEVSRQLLLGKETELTIGYFWAMAKVPKGDLRRIYFVWNDAIRAYHNVTRVDQDRIYMSATIYEIEPIPMKGFRGYRYFQP
jgi:hypothetical protein